MIESHAIQIKYRGRPALLSVIRNDGNCWGRIRFPDMPEALDVVTRKDHYEEGDDEALAAFERASRNPRCVEEAIGWLE